MARTNHWVVKEKYRDGNSGSRALICFFTLMTAVLILGACQSAPNIFVTEDGLSGKEQVLVLPFKDLTRTYGTEGIIRCPLTGSFFVAGDVPKEAPDILTGFMKDHLSDHTDFRLSFGLAYPENIHATASRDFKLYSERELIIKAGKEKNVEAVITGFIFRYKERIGNSYSVESPASVAFGIHMLRISDGRSLFFGHFDETQHSLSENLFKIGTFIKRKASWITAEEMARTGMNDMLNELMKK